MSSLFEQLKVPFLTVLFTLLCFFILVRLFGPIPFAVNSITTTKPDLFTVDGTGEVSSVPSTAYINLGITQTASTAEEAKNKANKVINDITAKLKSLGVGEKHIKTSNFSSYPERQLSGLNTISGYTVNENLEVTFDTIDKANQGLDIATAAGANSIGGVQFSVDESKREELEQQARILAIKNAKEKAQKLAQAAGIRLGRVLNISENPVSRGIVPMAVNSVAMDKGTSVPTQLNPGENKIQIQVSLSFETL